jgi:hypothetical protein
VTSGKTKADVRTGQAGPSHRRGRRRYGQPHARPPRAASSATPSRKVTAQTTPSLA